MSPTGDTSSGSGMSKPSRPSYKARKTSNSGFVVTSRPVKSSSGDAEGWTAVDLDRAPSLEHRKSYNSNEAQSNAAVSYKERMPSNAATGRARHSSQTWAAPAPFEVQDTPKDVKTTDHIQLARDSQGRRMVNQYIRMHEIGRGSHGRVWLCEEVNLDTGAHISFCAMKEVLREDQQRSLKKAQHAAHGPGFLGFGPAIQPLSAYDMSAAVREAGKSEVSSSGPSRPASVHSVPPTPTGALSPSAFALSRELHRSSLAQHQGAESSRPRDFENDDGFRTPVRYADSDEPSWIGSSNQRTEADDHARPFAREIEVDGSDFSSIFGPDRSSLQRLPRSQGRSGDIADMQNGLVPDEEMNGSYGLAGIGRQRSLRRPARNALYMDEKVRQEIAIMKRCHHNHVVQLKEVINDPLSRKIFMVLEYMAGGQLNFHQPSALGDPTMTVDQCRQIFRDVLLGLEYLHYQGIIHRDIKPANLLWTDDTHTCVKISDFGVSHVSEMLVQGDASRTEEEALRTTVGSPAFIAPELCALADPGFPSPDSDLRQTSPPSTRGSDMSHYFATFSASAEPTQMGRIVAKVSRPDQSRKEMAKTREAPPIGKAIDVWALGVTLYATLFGRTPFTAETEFQLFNVIPFEEAPIYACMGLDRKPTQSEEGREVIDLLDRLLCKNPIKRISISEAKNHPWTLRNLANAQEWLQQTDPAHAPALTVTSEEVQQATAVRMGGQTSSRIGLKGSFRRAMTKFGNAVGVKQRRRSASSLSANMLERSDSSQSKPASRQPSSSKREANTHNSAQANVAAPSDTTHHLTKTISGSSAATSSSSPVLSRGPSRQVSQRSHASPRSLQENLLRVETCASQNRPRSAASLWSPASPEPETDAKPSLTRRVWDKFRSGGRAQNSEDDGSQSLQARLDYTSSAADDSDVRSVVSSQMGRNDAGPEAAGVARLLDRADFDSFGRRRISRGDEVQQDDLSDDSLSELEYEQSQPAFTFNEGRGWECRTSQPSGTTPEAAVRASPNVRTWPDAQLFTTATLLAEDENAIYSGEDADAEQESDRGEEDGLELNFSRRRRPTNPSDVGSPANTSAQTSRSGTPGRQASM